LISVQSKEKQCELLLSIGNHWWWRDVSLPLLNQSLVKAILPEVELSILGDNSTLLVLPYLCRKLPKSNVVKALIEKINGIQNIYGRFLRVVLQALQDPKNYDVDNEARVVESQLPKTIRNYGWRTSNILGPSACDFNSIGSWKEFKQKIGELSSKDPKWIAKSIDFKRSQGIWICLFFHPDHWSLLVEQNLITESECNSILNTPLGNILSMPKVPLDIFHISSLFYEEFHEIPLYEIVHVVLEILNKEEIERVSKSQSLEALLYMGKIQLVSIEDMENLLYKANNLPSIPRVWASAILRLCMNVPGINLELLIDFWDKNKHSNPRFPFMHEEKFPNAWNSILNRLLDSDDTNVFELSLAILNCPTSSKQIQGHLLEKLLAKSSNFLNSNDISCRLYYNALLNLDPSLDEFSLWIKPEVIHLMHKSPGMLDRLSRRFASASDPKFKLDHEKLRKQLLVFLARRYEYPTTIVLGALEAILKIDEVTLPNLNTKIWQQCLDD
jgi:hypothetical protein